MTQQNNPNQGQDQVKLDKGFEYKCLNCGSTRCKYVDWRGNSSATGPYGALELRCADCGQEETIIENY